MTSLTQPGQDGIVEFRPPVLQLQGRRLVGRVDPLLGPARRQRHARLLVVRADRAAADGGRHDQRQATHSASQIVLQPGQQAPAGRIGLVRGQRRPRRRPSCPPTRIRPGGTVSIAMRTGMRCASRTQVRSGSPWAAPTHWWRRDVADAAAEAFDMAGQRGVVAHQLDARRVADMDPLDLGLFEIAVHPERVGIDDGDPRLPRVDRSCRRAAADGSRSRSPARTGVARCRLAWPRRAPLGLHPACGGDGGGVGDPLLLLPPRRSRSAPAAAARRTGATAACCRAASTCACACAMASRKRSGSMTNSTSPLWTSWLSCTGTAVTVPDTSGATSTTCTRTRPSRVHGASM